MRNPRRLLFTAAIVCFAAVVQVRADWYIAVNPVTGSPEAVWSSKPQGQATANVLYSYLDGSSWAPSTTLSTIGTESSGPVLAFGPDGARKVAWETGETTSRILLKTQAGSGGSWSAVIVVSDPDLASAGPSVASYDERTFVSFETTSSSGRSVAVSKIDADSNVERGVVRTTTRTDPLATELHVDTGHLWLDWIDSGSSLGYAVWSDGSWGAVQYETYQGEEDVKEGRERIREIVLTAR